VALSENIKPIAGTDSCQVSHLGYCVSGRMKVFMDDGSEGECGRGDVVAIPPGHDAEVMGDDPCVFLDFGEIGDYVKRGRPAKPPKPSRPKLGRCLSNHS
jgi:hypothetical protein